MQESKQIKPTDEVSESETGVRENRSKHTVKTIFYKLSEDSNGEYWISNYPLIEWFTLDNILYNHKGSSRKRAITVKDDRSVINSATIMMTVDDFTDEGIIRRVVVDTLK